MMEIPLLVTDVIECVIRNIVDVQIIPVVDLVLLEVWCAKPMLNVKE